MTLLATGEFLMKKVFFLGLIMTIVIQTISSFDVIDTHLCPENDGGY